MNANLLKGKMAEKGVNQKELAQAIGISINSMSRKLSGKREFQLSEAVAISDFLQLENPGEIFFGQ
ncbi:MAG: helix-turn-helix transcriptional regulator [Firmicutes bacterium]|nr:helix-turn-helix transcriptional regulator [Bacillota bacterium]